MKNKRTNQLQDWKERREEMSILVDEGWSYSRIGAKYNMSKARVGQIIKIEKIKKKMRTANTLIHNAKKL
jgi:Mor family transcriptional regulator